MTTTFATDAPPTQAYDGNNVTERYVWHAAHEIGNADPAIDAYARLIVTEYNRLVAGEITMDEFKANTLPITTDTPLNYIQSRIVEYYPH